MNESFTRADVIAGGHELRWIAAMAQAVKQERDFVMLNSIDADFMRLCHLWIMLWSLPARIIYKLFNQ